jgi:hypothetical protein
MDPYKVLGISPEASPQDVKRAYLAMASKYHPDAGGDAWAFEQVRSAYELISERQSGATATKLPTTERATANEAFRPLESQHPSRSHSKHPLFPFLFGQLPLHTETSWFILLNVLDLVLTNVLLRLNAIEANPIANYFLEQFGFVGMICFKLFSVAVVCVLSQLIAIKSLTKAKLLLWCGCGVVTLVLVYSCRLILFAGQFR